MGKIRDGHWRLFNALSARVEIPVAEHDVVSGCGNPADPDLAPQASWDKATLNLKASLQYQLPIGMQSTTMKSPQGHFRVDEITSTRKS